MKGTKTRIILVIECPKCKEKIRIAFSKKDLKDALKKIKTGGE